MDNNNADILGAIDALATVMQSLEQRQQALNGQLNVARKRRRAALDALVATFLPAISKSTLAVLQKEMPPFANDPKVVAAFSEHRRIFHFFKTAGYETALLMLQAQLKHYLERTNAVADDDRAIKAFEAERGVLIAQQAEAMEMLRLVEKARHISSPLPAAVVVGINSFAQRGRTKQQRAVPRRASLKDSAQTSDAESDADLWIWMMTDIPTSFRTLLLGSVSPHHRHDNESQISDPPVRGQGGFGGAGASEDFYSLDLGLKTAIPLGVAAAVLADGNQPASAQEISTDDSLGVFS